MSSNKRLPTAFAMLFISVMVYNIYAASPPPISLSFQSYNPTQNQSDQGLGIISGASSTTDYAVMCGSPNVPYGTAPQGNGSPCTAPNDYLVRVGLAEGGVSYNTQSLPAGTYQFEACDYTYWENTQTTDCTSPKTVMISAGSQSTASTTSSSSSTSTTPSTSVYSTTYTTNPTTSPTTTIQTSATAECNLTGIINGVGEIEFYNTSGAADYSNLNTSYQFPCGSTVYIYALTNNVYNFTAWKCMGRGCYSGNNQRVSFTINNNITEIANFGNISSTGHKANVTTSTYSNTSSNGENPNYNTGAATQTSSSGSNGNLYNSIMGMLLTVLGILFVIILIIGGALFYFKKKPPTVPSPQQEMVPPTQQ